MRGNKKLKIIDRYLGIFICVLFGFMSKLFSFFAIRKKVEPRKILLIKLAALGDTVLLVPAIRNLRKKYKDAFISILVTKINKDIIENCPYVNKIIEFPLQECLKNPFKIISFTRKLGKEGYDVVIDFEQWSRISSVFAYFSGIPKRIGFKTEKQYRHYVYTDVVELRKNQHEVECFLDIIRSLGCDIDDKKLEVFIDNEDVKTVNNFLVSNKITEKFIIFHPGCGKAGFPREWDKDKYVELAGRIINNFKLKIIITGDKSERDKMNYIAQKVNKNDIILADNITGRKLAELFKRALLVVCSNTGAMHVACAVGSPVVALHGPTDPVKWGPWQNENSFVVRKKMDCSPCLYLGFEYACSSFECMKRITVDDVFTVVAQFIGRISNNAKT